MSYNIWRDYIYISMCVCLTTAFSQPLEGIEI